MNTENEQTELSECQACGGPLEAEEVNLEDYQGGKLFILDHIQAKVCRNCGEIWLPESAMKEFAGMIEAIKLRRQKEYGKIANKSKDPKGGK